MAKGRDQHICGSLENNLILSTYREVLQSENKPVVPLALWIENEAPIGKGCGSSASARLAGIALADHFGKLRWSDRKIVGEASRREHHPDNAAACWMGGVAVAKMSGESEAQIARIVPKGSGLYYSPCLISHFPPKKRARCCRRNILERMPSPIFRIPCCLWLRLFRDVLICWLRPWKTAFTSHIVRHCVRLLPALQKLAGTQGILGAVLSGAGPSVLVFLDPKAKVNKVKAHVAAHLRASGLTAELISTGN